ncbi:MAG: hypothetical protein ACU85V_04735 [Gammaproteobacteria bacterium]
MSGVSACPPPRASLLGRYAGGEHYVDARRADELLLLDIIHRTRSWLQVSATPGGFASLYFGSAVLGRAGPSRRSLLFRGLLEFHRRYSVALLAGAARRLR